MFCGQAAVDKVDVLSSEADVAPPFGRVDLAEWDTVNRNPPGSWLQQATNQVDNRAFAGSGGADQSRSEALLPGGTSRSEGRASAVLTGIGEVNSIETRSLSRSPVKRGAPLRRVGLVPLSSSHSTSLTEVWWPRCQARAALKARKKG